MRFLELQKELVQTRKARKGVKNRMDYFRDCDFQEEQFWKAVYKKAVWAANEVVQHYEETGKIEKVKVLFADEQDYQKAYLKGLERESLLEKELNRRHDEIMELQDKYIELQRAYAVQGRELEQVRAELSRAKTGGRYKDFAKRNKIRAYKQEHSGASIREIAGALKCSTTTVQRALKGDDE